MEPLVVLASIKLHFFERRVRCVVEPGASAVVAGGPGVDLVERDAERVLEAAAALCGALAAVEPGIRVRSMLVDRRSRRVVATLAGDGGRPRVVKLLEGALFERLMALCDDLVGVAGPLVVEALRRRGP